VGGSPRRGRPQRAARDALIYPGCAHSRSQVRRRTRGGAVSPRALFASANHAVHAGCRCKFWTGATGWGLGDLRTVVGDVFHMILPLLALQGVR
jgi:hypothetical protein